MIEKDKEKRELFLTHRDIEREGKRGIEESVLLKQTKKRNPSKFNFLSLLCFCFTSLLLLFFVVFFSIWFKKFVGFVRFLLKIMEGEVGTSTSMAAVADSLKCETQGNGKGEVVVNESKSAKYPLSFWEIGVAASVVFGYALGLGCVYLTMPASDYSFLKLPRNLEDLQILR